MNTRSVFCVALLALSATTAFAHHVQKSGTPSAPAASAPTVSVAGFVSETTIDNRVTGTTSRLVILHADDGTRSVLLGASASALSAGASYVVTGRASGRALFVDSARMTSTTDVRANQLSASPLVGLDGTLRLGHADNFDGTPSEFFYAIVGSGAQYRVSAATLADGLENGMTASVTGHLAADGELVADRIVIVARTAAARAESAVLAARRSPRATSCFR